MAGVGAADVVVSRVDGAWRQAAVPGSELDAGGRPGDRQLAAGREQRAAEAFPGGVPPVREAVPALRRAAGADGVRRWAGVYRREAGAAARCGGPGGEAYRQGAGENGRGGATEGARVRGSTNRADAVGTPRVPGGAAGAARAGRLGGLRVLGGVCAGGVVLAIESEVWGGGACGRAAVRGGAVRGRTRRARERRARPPLHGDVFQVR